MIDADTLPVDEDGVPYMHLELISQGGLADLATVAEYRIEEYFGSISHHVRLCNGGKLRFAYALSGELLELSGEKLHIRITPEGVCTVGPYRPSEWETGERGGRRRCAAGRAGPAPAGTAMRGKST